MASKKEKEEKEFYIDVCAKLRQIGRKIDIIKKTTELTESLSRNPNREFHKEEDE